MSLKILDSFALMAFFNDEVGAEVVENLIYDAYDSDVKLLMSVVNLGEVWYSISRTRSPDVAENFIQTIFRMPIEIINADWQLTRQAALYKSRGNIAYADCFTAALAKLNDAEVVTGDKEFAILEDDVKVLWLK